MADALQRLQVPRPAPLGELSLEGVIARADELAKRWAVSLILARPLVQAGDLALGDLARDAPTACAQVIAAVRSDLELEQLLGGPQDAFGHTPARRLAGVAGARDPAALVRAVEALRAVLWEAVREELAGTRPERLAEACDRLSWVCAGLLAAMMTVGSPDQADRDTPQPASAAARAAPAVIVDERSRIKVEPTPREASLVPGIADAEIEIRDERAEAAAAGWIASIARQLQRVGREGLPLALLLVEVADLEELRRTRGPAELERIFAQLEEVLAIELGHLDGLVPGQSSAREGARTLHPGALVTERPGRYWLVAPRTDRVTAAELGGRLVRVGTGTLGKPGAPLPLLVGAAICPDDGREASALAAHADVALYAERAAARRDASHVDEPA